MNYTITRLEKNAPLPFSLLLLADETMDAIERYIYQSDVYVLISEEATTPLGVFALYPLSSTEMEIKNIAVSETSQGKGIGSYMIGEIKNIALQAGYRTLIVGTADQGIAEIQFYKRNGFVPYTIKENFFLLHYPRPIIADNGIALKDMVMLKTEL